MRIGDTYYNRGACKNGALIRMGERIGMGALIDKNTSKGGRLFERGRLLEGGH